MLNKSFLIASAVSEILDKEPDTDAKMTALRMLITALEVEKQNAVQQVMLNKMLKGEISTH
jgi:hypothetical protein